MNGDPLAAHVRAILKDEQSPTVKGSFYLDEEIRLVLNMAQMALCDYCLTALDWQYVLRGLYTYTSVADSLTAQAAGIPMAVPGDYMHYLSAEVGDATNGTAGNLRVAKVYIGGNSIGFIDHKNRSAIILNGSLYFVHARQRYMPGRLWYIQRPTKIGLTSLGDNPASPITGATPMTSAEFNKEDFDSDVYYTIICRHAASIIGMKETYTQREKKANRRSMRNMMRELFRYPVYSPSLETRVGQATDQQQKLQGDQ